MVFEIGRLCMKIAGRDAGKKALVVDVLENNYVLLDGLTRRRKCNIMHLEPLDKVLKISKGASTDVVLKVLKDEGIEILEKKQTKDKKETTPRPKKQKVKKDKPVKVKKETKKKAVKKEEKKTETTPKKETKKEEKKVEEKPAATTEKTETKQTTVKETPKPQEEKPTEQPKE
jgi:large subunit ribosomal protein L14e